MAGHIFWNWKMCILKLIKTFLLAVVYLVFLIPCSTGQPSPILLNNPSFEDVPNHSRPPSGWYFCGPIGESPPDVHPNGFFKVDHEALHGDTYVGMVTRDNDSWECLGQQLEKPLVSGQCYQFTIYLAQSQTYESVSRSTMAPALFTIPVILRIWGGNQNCQKLGLLTQSEPISHEDWIQHTFYFQPKTAFTHFFLEVYFDQQTKQSLQWQSPFRSSWPDPSR